MAPAMAAITYRVKMLPVKSAKISALSCFGVTWLPERPTIIHPTRITAVPLRSCTESFSLSTYGERMMFQTTLKPAIGAKIDWYTAKTSRQ